MPDAIFPKASRPLFFLLAQWQQIDLEYFQYMHLNQIFTVSFCTAQSQVSTLGTSVVYERLNIFHTSLQSLNQLRPLLNIE